ncbi:hypothetical protein DFJ74DRAFT_314965 [Hyaloraphidium curvatum]|nr:hypothetical protein DFJ74DRAFT_314965 [Hyaloraphidium curvatum]
MLLLDRKSGLAVWTVQLAGKDGLPTVWHEAGDFVVKIFATGSPKGTALTVVRISLVDGSVREEYVLPDVVVDVKEQGLENLVRFVDHADGAVKTSYLIVKPAGSSPIVTHRFGTRDAETQPQAVPAGGPRAMVFESGPSQFDKHVSIRLSDGGVLVVGVEASGRLKPTTQVDQRSKPMLATARTLGAAQSLLCLTYAQPWKSTLTFEVINIIDDKIEPFTFNFSARENGFPVQSFFEVGLKSGSSKYGFLVVFEDGSVNFYDTAGLVWKREESLSEVADAAFIDFAEEKLLVQDTAETDKGSTLNVYLHRLRLHLRSLTGIFALGRDQSAGECSSNSTGVKQIFRDVFGLRKLILFLSKSGKLVALDSESGAAVWERYIAMEAADANAISQTATVVGREILLVRSTAEQYPPIVTVVLTAKDAGKHFTITHNINAMDGIDFGATPMTIQAMELASAIILPEVDGADSLHVIALVDAAHNLRILPERAATANLVKDLAAKLVFFDAKVGADGVRGFRISANGGIRSPIPPVEAWQINFPEGERLAVVGEKPAYERVASIGRVLGDRSVLYKYLNPHVAVFGTVRDDPAAFSVYVVDTVKGAILYHAVHPGGGSNGNTGGLHIAQAENWVVYTFWNSGGPDASSLPEPAAAPPSDSEGAGKKKKKRKARRKGPVSKGQEVVALELYESGQPDSKLAPQSSYQLVRPYVIAQAYNFLTGIDALSITTTRSGITTREALVVTPAGQLLGISRRFLDPRRPTAALSADDKEEGLIPYQAALPFNPRDVASYTHKLLGIDSIKTAPAFLESTSLVLAYGLDVFFTRRMPSKAFDMLSEDFSRISLVATMVALVVGIFAARHFSNRKRLYDAFQT